MQPGLVDKLGHQTERGGSNDDEEDEEKEDDIFEDEVNTLRFDFAGWHHDLFIFLGGG